MLQMETHATAHAAAQASEAADALRLIGFDDVRGWVPDSALAAYSARGGALERLVEIGPAQALSRQAAGHLVLDVRAHRCTRDGVDIELTSREFTLLEALMRRKGDVVSKQALLDDVWDFAFDGDGNIVEVYVGYLRRKIDRPFGHRSLETVRGAGYRLRADGA